MLKEYFVSSFLQSLSSRSQRHLQPIFFWQGVWDQSGSALTRLYSYEQIGLYSKKGGLERHTCIRFKSCAKVNCASTKCRLTMKTHSSLMLISVYQWLIALWPQPFLPLTSGSDIRCLQQFLLEVNLTGHMSFRDDEQLWVYLPWFSSLLDHSTPGVYTPQGTRYKPHGVCDVKIKTDLYTVFSPLQMPCLNFSWSGSWLAILGFVDVFSILRHSSAAVVHPRALGACQ